MRRIIVAVALLSTLILFGCKKQIACDPADSEAVCKAIPAVSSFGYLG